jgi:hypothetical protein
VRFCVLTLARIALGESARAFGVSRFYAQAANHDISTESARRICATWLAPRAEEMAEASSI